MKKNVWRAVIEVGFVIFLFYSNLLMGSRWTNRYPGGVPIPGNFYGLKVPHEDGQVLKITPELIGFLRRAVHQDAALGHQHCREIVAPHAGIGESPPAAAMAMPDPERRERPSKTSALPPINAPQRWAASARVAPTPATCGRMLVIRFIVNSLSW